MSKNKLQAVTIIETLITLLAISFMIAGPIFFVSRSFAYSKFVQDKIVAISLAQEGLELATSLRNNATTTFSAEVDSICLSNVCLIDWNGSGNVPSLNSCDMLGSTCRLTLLSNTYRHVAGGEPTKYLRALSFEKDDNMHAYTVSSRVWSDEDVVFKVDVNLKKILYAN
jgi:hypothetical protein